MNLEQKDITIVNLLCAYAAFQHAACYDQRQFCHVSLNVIIIS